MSARATFTHDYIDTGKVGKVVTIGQAQELSPTDRVGFRLLDDDKILYYVGYIESDDAMDETAMFDLLYNFGANYAGTVALEINGELVIG